MSFPLKKYSVFVILCIFYPLICTAEKAAKEKNANVPIVITSVKMRSDQKANQITFIGNVVAERGNLIISSDEMTVYNVKNREIEKIVARGNVQIKSERRFASGDRAVYSEGEGKIVLTGHPRAWENENEIMGTKMIFLLNEDRFVVIGSEEKKIKLTFYPEQNKKKKKPFSKESK